MLAVIDGYTSAPAIVSVAKSWQVADILLGQNLSVVLIQGDTMTFLPQNERLSLDEQSALKFADLSDYDVLSIAEDGAATVKFSNSSVDNVLFITSKCNSNCVMCPSSDYSRRQPDEISLDGLLELARHFPKDTPHITITGGEPFLMGRDIFKLFSYLRDSFCGTEFLVLTNGRALSIPAYIGELSKTAPAGITFGIPVHGSSPQKHDEVTRVPGSFRQTISGIKGLLSLGIKVELRIVACGLNKDDIDSIADLVVRELGEVDSVKIIGLEMLGNAWVNRENVWITYREAFEACESAVLKMIRAGIDVRFYNFPLCSVPRGYWHICAKSISAFKIRFPEECAGCAVEDACCGLFAGSYRHAREHVKPILEAR